MSDPNPKYHVLIVEDQRDARRVLRAGLEMLEHEIQVIEVPSGEEAMLVIARQPIDLLVVDVRLPGISGLELIERTQSRNPYSKYILITGLEDPKTRQEVINAGVDAFFFKPIEMAEFLDAARRCLGLMAPRPPGEERETLATESAGEPTQTLSGRLTALRQELDAVCVLLMNDHGQLMAQAGNLPDIINESSLISSLMATFSASGKVAYLLGSSIPVDLLFFAGQEFNLLLAHVGRSMGLLLVIPSTIWKEEHLRKLLAVWLEEIQELRLILSDMGILIEERVDRQIILESRTPEEEVREEQVFPELDMIFDRAQQRKLKPEEVDAFWDTANADRSVEVTSADSISYEQARRLGLAPEED